MGDVQRTVVLGEPDKKMLTYWDAFTAGIDTAYETLSTGIETENYES